MPVNPAKIALAVQGGLATVCATCQRYWEARDRGVPGDKCTSKTGCGSPLAGDDFHDYDGPIADFSQWCFICGEDPVSFLESPGSTRIFGVCERHKPLLASLSPVGLEPPQQVVVRDNGKRKLADELVRVRKSVFDRIEETEREFEKERERRG